MKQRHKILIVDDHKLFSNALKRLVDSFHGFEVIGQLHNGIELVDYLKGHDKPDLVLLDVNMPHMGGLETMGWLQDHHPNLKVLILSMDDHEITIISLLRKGARGYILKDINPIEFERALIEVVEKGFFYTDSVSTLLHKQIINPVDYQNVGGLKARELEFLEYVCTEKTYKEIAGAMFLSPKTIDGYREALFKKFQVHSRTGLVLYALKNKLIKG